jgi:invasion protein IalB
MSNIVRKSIFVFLGIAFIVSIFLITKFSYVEASKKDDKKFDDWSAGCTKEDANTKVPAICLLSQQVNITEDNTQKPLALYQIGYIGSKKELKLIVTLPLGIRLDSGTSIISSSKLVAPGKFTVCNQSGCQAISDISEEDLKTILNSSENKIGFMNTEGKQIDIPFSAKGLSEGLKYIK